MPSSQRSRFVFVCDNRNFREDGKPSIVTFVEPSAFIFLADKITSDRADRAINGVEDWAFSWDNLRKILLGSVCAGPAMLLYFAAGEANDFDLDAGSAVVATDGFVKSDLWFKCDFGAAIARDTGCTS
jgi:hypothetical protein